MPPRYRHVPVVVNPASGPDRPVLKVLNQVFRATGVDWDIHLTKRAGDAERWARELADSGAEVVAVYGGDGTVKEVARALIGRETPLAIFPGGTGNALAVELDLPLNLAQAVELVCGAPSAVRLVDMGQIGEHMFVLRASMGFEAELLRATARELKDRLGQLAYPLAALQQLIGDQPTTSYRITLDGQEVETEGVQCTIANSTQMGVSGMRLAQGASVSDGLLDVIVLTSVDFLALAEIATSNLAEVDLGIEVRHWQGRLITIAADPPQAVALGGDVIAQTPVTARVLPGAIRVIVPDAS